MQERPEPKGSGRSASIRKSVEGVLGRVLDLLAGLLDAGRGLIALALGFQVPVSGDLATQVLPRVGGLVAQSHHRLLSSWAGLLRWPTRQEDAPSGAGSHRTGHGKNLTIGCQTGTDVNWPRISAAYWSAFAP